MNQDIATIGIEVDTRDLSRADRQLDKLTGTSRKTEKATDSLRRANEKLNRVLKVMAFAAVAAGIAATTYALKRVLPCTPLLKRKWQTYQLF